MSKNIFIALYALCNSLLLSAQGPVYQKLYGYTNYYCIAPGIIPTSDGFFLVVGGMSNGSIYHQDIVASKISIFGDTIWTRRYGGLGSEMAYNAVEDSTGYMIFGVTTSFGDGSRNFMWIKTDINGDTLSTGVYVVVQQRIMQPAVKAEITPSYTAQLSPSTAHRVNNTY